MILALETSCDDTCASVISSQGVHSRYGGVVPEIASRHHLELIGAVVDDALERAGVGLAGIELVAVTRGPGLIPALLVGVATAKALAAVGRVPLAPVDHLHGHVAASFLSTSNFEPPFLSLVASGGHTLLAHVPDRGPGFEVLGQTLDDAAGEAFDKGARLLGLGYPGGPVLERRETVWEPHVQSNQGNGEALGVGDLDAEVDGLSGEHAGGVESRRNGDTPPGDPGPRPGHGEQTGLSRLAVGGGVAANGPLRRRLTALGVPLDIPPPELCTDNAAMIASAARYVSPLPYPEYLGLDVYASGETALAAA